MKSLGFDRMRETTLGGNKWKSDSHPMQWTPKADDKLTVAETSVKIRVYSEGDKIIEFQPMEIKSFILFCNY